MLNAFAIDCIERVRLGFVASVTPGGRPSVSPKGTFVVLHEHRLAFGEIRSPGTISNIGHSPEVEVNFVDSFTRKGWRIRGTTSVLRRGSAAFDAIYPQWQALWGDLAERINVIVTINISEAKPLSSPPYDDGATEAKMVALYKEKFSQMYP
jgi:hypothetical protein